MKAHGLPITYPELSLSITYPELNGRADEEEADPNGERLIWLPAAVVDRLAGMRDPGEFSGWRRRTHGTRAVALDLGRNLAPVQVGHAHGIGATRPATLNVAASAAILSMR